MTTERQAAATAAAIATALLAGPWRRPQMVRRIAVALGQRRAQTWVGTLVGEVQTAHPRPPADRPRELARFVRTTQGWLRGLDATPPPPAGPVAAGTDHPRPPPAPGRRPARPGRRGTTAGP